MCSSLYSFSAAPKKSPPPADDKSDESVEYSIVGHNEYGDGMTEEIPLSSLVWKDGKRVVIDHTKNTARPPITAFKFGLTAIGQPGLMQLLTQSHPNSTATDAEHSAMPVITEAEREAAKKALAEKKKYYEHTQNASTPPS